MRMLDDEDSNDVEVTWSDQQKINQFSRLNTRQADAQHLLDLKREEREQIDEVSEELEMLELSEGFDDEELDEDGDGEEKNDAAEGQTKEEGGVQGGRKLPFKIGDAFIYVTVEKAIQLLEKEKESREREVEEIEKEIQDCEVEMKKLKVDLYAKFGSNISECGQSHPQMGGGADSDQLSPPLLPMNFTDLERD